MREIATYYSTFFILSTYISIIAVPLCLLLQKKNLINTKNSLGMVYAIIFSALLISVLNPQSGFLISASDALFADSINNIFYSFRELVWNILVSVFSAEPVVYTALVSVLGIACAVGAALYLASILVIIIKVNKLDKFKKIGRLTILVDEENVTPHVFSFFHKSYVVVPKHVLNKKDFLKTAISHELQHIRNGDTHSIYLWQFFKCLLWINPFIHIILSYIKNLQELRVDENLIHDKKINYKVYLKTLSWFVSEGRQQPRYSLSHSIFGWSTFKELKMRISNIHRVRPIRSQPLFCLCFLAGNIFALLVIGNSSPKFQYSLYEIQRMYMPEYMKTEFIFKADSILDGPIDAENTLEFAKEREIKIRMMGEYYQAIKDSYPELRETFAKKYNGRRKLWAAADFYNTLDYNMKTKVIEYSDEYAVLQIDLSYVDMTKIKSLDGSTITKESLEKFFDETAKHTIKFKRNVKVNFNKNFEIEGVKGTFHISKKLSPQKQISFFPKLPDLIAEEKSNYESKL